MTWTDLQSETKLYNWTFEDNLFSLTNADTTLKYQVAELTYDSFVFSVKYLTPYSDSTKLFTYEEYQYVYHLNRVGE